MNDEASTTSTLYPPLCVGSVNLLEFFHLQGRLLKQTSTQLELITVRAFCCSNRNSINHLRQHG